MIEFAITSLAFSGEEHPIVLEQGSLTILVGANSSGKSRALREIARWFQEAESSFSESRKLKET